MSIKKETWFHILIFLIISTVLSGLFRLGMFEWYNTLSLPFGLTPLAKSIFEGVGPIVSAAIMLLVLNKKSTISLLGENKLKSVLMVVLPIVLFTVFGANNDQNLNKHYYGFIVGISLMIYAIFEEYGWRGFMQNELANVNALLRSIIIGTFWYLWHLNFISNDTNLIQELSFFGILVLASWGIGAIANKTKSIFVSACFHVLGNILSFSPLISNSINSQTQYIIFGVCLVLWVILVNTWEKPLFKNQNE